MSNERDQWAEAAARLTVLTQEGQLPWTADAYTDDKSVIGATYRSEYKDRRLRLQKRRVETDSWPDGRRIIEQPILEFVDLNDNVMWTFPEMDALSHLYEAVQYQTAGVKDFLDDLLTKGSA